MIVRDDEAHTDSFMFIDDNVRLAGRSSGEWLVLFSYIIFSE